MANEISTDLNSSVTVQVKPAQVTTTGYDELLEDAQRLRANVDGITVTEENIQQSKKARAAINKKIAALKSSRTAVKKELLLAMEDLDTKISTVAKVAGEANNFIDVQIKQLEEEARAGKHKQLVELFEKYSAQYDFPKLIADGLVDVFFEGNANLLNKSVSIAKGESVIADFLESVWQDVQTIAVLPNAEKTLAEYSQHFNVQRAIRTIAERVAREEAAKIEKEVAPVVHKNDGVDFSNAEPVKAVHGGTIEQAEPTNEWVSIRVDSKDTLAAVSALKDAHVRFSFDC